MFRPFLSPPASDVRRRLRARAWLARLGSLGTHRLGTLAPCSVKPGSYDVLRSSVGWWLDVGFPCSLQGRAWGVWAAARPCTNTSALLGSEGDGRASLFFLFMLFLFFTCTSRHDCSSGLMNCLKGQQASILWCGSDECRLLYGYCWDLDGKLWNLSVNVFTEPFTSNTMKLINKLN